MSANPKAIHEFVNRAVNQLRSEVAKGLDKTTELDKLKVTQQAEMLSRWEYILHCIEQATADEVGLSRYANLISELNVQIHRLQARINSLEHQLKQLRLEKQNDK